ncbi:MAG: exosortase/archaeosortase family protein [Candidatus Bathyarchaeia archaeon]|nr:exosortase/archaeosortase family protein [Candidatus Bathyarchaeota archaeon]
MRNHKIQILKIVSKILLYILAFTIISSTIYFLFDYGFLKAAIAEHSTGILNALGINSNFLVLNNRAFINQIEIVKECTGIQVIAVFSGLIIPLPKVSFKNKIKAITLVFFAVYLANVLRIVIEIWLLYKGILPWSQAHGPLGTLLSIISIVIFFLMTEKFIPEINYYINEGVKFIVKQKNYKQHK